MWRESEGASERKEETEWACILDTFYSSSCLHLLSTVFVQFNLKTHGFVIRFTLTGQTMSSDQDSKEGQPETRSFIRETKGLIQEAFRMSPKPMKASFKSYISDTTSSSSADLQSNDNFDRSGDHSIKSDQGCDEDEEWTTLPDGNCVSNLTEKSDSYETLDIISGLSETRQSNKGVTIRSNSYAMGLDNPVVVEDTINSNLITPTTSFTSLRNGEAPLLKPIHAVQRYSLSSRRTKGSIGQLILTNCRLKFLNYSEDGKSIVNTNQHPTRFPPFDFHSFLDESSEGSITEFDEDIDLIMIFAIKSGPLNNIMSSTTMNSSSIPLTTSSGSSSSHIILRIDCNDFRCVEFLLKSNEESRILVDTLEKLYNKQFSPQISNQSTISIPSDSHSAHVPLLWTLLWSRYGTQIDKPKGKCLNCISKLNLDMFPATKDVPSFDQLESVYSRVIESCHTYSSTKTFITSTGKWIKVVAKIMKIVDQVVHHLTFTDTRPFHPDQVEMESESLFVLLLKPIIISLVQVVLNPKSRTINGLEKIIFKQFTMDTVSSVTFSNFKIYRVNSMEGLRGNFKKRYPNHILFTLFIDCLNQILTFSDHNFTQFEFNSLFLIRLFDLQFIPSTPSSNVTWTCYDSIEDPSSSTTSATSKLTMSATSSAAKINSFINNTLSGGKTGSLIQMQPQSYKQVQDDFELCNRGIRKQNHRHSISNPLSNGCMYKENLHHENSIPVAFAAVGAPSTLSLTFLKNPFYLAKTRSLPEIPTSIAQITFFEGLFLRWHYVGKTLDASKPFETLEQSPRIAVADGESRTSSHVSYYNRFQPFVQVMAIDHLLFGPWLSIEKFDEESYQETTL